MARILVLYYSSYGHVAQLADAVAAGVIDEGGMADIRRVPETVSAAVAAKAGYVADPAHPEIEGVDALADYDAIVVGAPTRFGRMPSQLAAFLDQAGGLWQSGALVGKVGAAFTSTATQHGGQETTIFSILTNLLHFGMTIVGLDYGYQGQSGVTEVTGGSPYGASTIADGDGSRQPSDAELGGGRYLGARVARLAAQLEK